MYKLKSHEETCPKNVNRLQLPCEECDKVFTQVYMFKDHLKLHENPEAFKCEICSKKFKSSFSLLYHKKTHK